MDEVYEYSVRSEPLLLRNPASASAAPLLAAASLVIPPQSPPSLVWYISRMLEPLKNYIYIYILHLELKSRPSMTLRRQIQIPYFVCVCVCYGVCDARERHKGNQPRATLCLTSLFLCLSLSMHEMR